MSNSKLVNYTRRSPFNSGTRVKDIDRITPHCIVGQWTTAQIANFFSDPRTGYAPNYGIAKDGQVVLCVDEDKRSWCTTSEENDQRAVTIECSCDVKDPYKFNDAVYNKLIELCIDICKRNEKDTLLWIDSKSKTLSYKPKENEMVLTVHRWFANKSCPGAWMYARMGELASKVTEKLKESTSAEKPKKVNIPSPPFTINTLTSKTEIKKEASKNAVKVGNADKGLYTITKVSGNYGMLKSGLGWIDLSDVKKVKINKAPSYLIQITGKTANIYAEANINSKVTGQIKDKKSYTVIEEKNGFGKLKSGAGWVKLSQVKQI